ncbi:MAG: hypothetical protein ABIT71_01820 [Vicinamibacteraceae bacterium]
MGATPNPLLRAPTKQPRAEGMGAMALGCLGTTAVCAALGYWAYRNLPAVKPDASAVPLIFAGLIGLFGGLGLTSLYYLIRGHGRGPESRHVLEARARTDGPPQDGKLIIATGTVRSDRPLVSPIGGVPCAAYDFRMFTARRSSKGLPEQVPVYWGYAGHPFALDSASRRYPVASVPFFTWESDALTDDDARDRARAFVRATGWETVEYGLLGTLDTVFRRVGEDSLTGVRRDFALAYDDAPDVALLNLEERVLPLDATASAFGAWSGSLGAIVAPPSPLPGSCAVVARGGTDGLDDQPGVPHTTRSYLASAIVFLLLAAGLFWVARTIIPTLH